MAGWEMTGEILNRRRLMRSDKVLIGLPDQLIERRAHRDVGPTCEHHNVMLMFDMKSP